jgi:hypothetical protein
MYYHVKIETKLFEHPCYNLDETDLSEVKKGVIIPYLKGERVRVSGYELLASDIISIEIVESKCTSMEYWDDSCKKDPYSPLPWDPDFMFKEEDDSYFRDIRDSLFEECELELKNPVRRFFHRVKKILQK